MNRSFVLLVFICISEMVVAQKCDLDVAASSQNRFTKKLKKWYKFLKQAVTDSSDPDCRACDLIRPPGQKFVDSERDPRIGCRCNVSLTDVYQCACCFKIKKFDILICSAAGFYSGEKIVYFLLSVDTYVVVHFNYSLEESKDERFPDITWFNDKVYNCISLPPPAEFMSACFRPKLERPSTANKHKWKLCGKLKFAILEVTFMKMNMKCFDVKHTFDEMKIEGQTNPTLDIDNPVTAEVNDQSYNSAVCLANTKKRNAQLGSSSRHTVEKKGSRINWREADSGETPPYLVVLHQKEGIDIELVHEDDKFPYIEAATKRIESEKWLNESEVPMFELNSGFCGGALLTRNRVLTVCACVRTFYIVNKLQKSLDDDDDIFPFDLRASDIFVDITGIVFSEAEDHRLVKDPAKFMTKSTCATRIEINDAWGLQTLMMVMAFEPEIGDPNPGQFVRWRPNLVRPGQQVHMVAFGMERRNWTWVFRNSSGGEINFDAHAVNVYFRQCPITDYGMSEIHKDQLVFDIGGRVSGFCTKELDSDLCYGKIGFPLIAGRELVGLASLPVDCEAAEGSIAGAIFDPVTIYEIESFLGINTSYLIRTPHIMVLAYTVTLILRLSGKQ